MYVQIRVVGYYLVVLILVGFIEMMCILRGEPRILMTNLPD